MNGSTFANPPPMHGQNAPIPSDPAEAARVDHTRLRRRMLYGVWREDARARLRTRMGRVKQSVYGEPDLTRNAFCKAYTNLAVLYSQVPTIGNTVDPTAAEAMKTVTDRAGLYPLMQRYMRDCLALREMLLRVEASQDRRGRVRVSYRPVFPDMVQVLADPAEPGRPVEVWELIQREEAPGTGRMIWTWEVWSIADEDEPVHRVLDSTGKLDISHLHGLDAGGAVGDKYPSMYRRNDGSPVLPYVLHHAARTGALWDTYQGAELVEGTLEVATKWTYIGHTERNAAFGKHFGVGVLPPTAATIGQGGAARQEMTMDPATFTFFGADPTAKNVQVGTLANPVSIIDMSQAVLLYEGELLTYAGESSDVSRTSTDIRSGFALAVSTEQKAAVTRRYAPIFATPDEEVLQLTAIVINRAVNREVYPEDGWTIEYADPQQSAVVAAAKPTGGPKLPANPPSEDAP